MTANLAGLLLLNALWLLAGFGVTGLAGLWCGRGAFEVIGVAYLAGVAAYGVVAQLLYVAGASMSRVEVVAVCGILALGGLRPAFARSRSAPGRLRPGWVGAGVLLVLAVIAVDLWWQPLWAYDSWTFWTPKAHALMALGGLDATWFTAPELLNRDYPLLLPAVEAAGFRFTGYETGLLDVQSLFFAAALLLVYAQTVVPRAPRWAIAMPFLIVLSPSLVDQLAAAEADIPLASFFACASLFAFLWHRERLPGALPLFGVFAAGTAATKAEGLPFVLALAAVITVAELGRSRRAAVVFAATAASALLAALLPWRLWMRAHDVPNQSSLGRVTHVGFLLHHAARVPTAATYLIERLLDPRAWLLLVPLLLFLTLLAAMRRARSTFVVIGIIGLSLLSLLVAYWTTSFELHYHLATSARRVITGPLLAWAFLVPLLFAGDTAAEAATLEPS